MTQIEKGINSKSRYFSSPTKKVRRSTTVELVWEDADKVRHSETNRVVYNALTTTLAKTLNEESEKNQTPLSEQLADYMEIELPDITEDDGSPLKVTKEVLAEMGTDNLIAINTAIREDVSGKKSQSEASQLT